MKVGTKYFTAMLLMITSMMTYAQELTVQEERLFNLKVYNQLEKYRNAGLLQDSPELIDEFVSAFASDSMLIYNDLLGILDGERVTVRQYVNALSEKSEAVKIHIKDVKKGEVRDAGDAWTMELMFNRTVEYFADSDYFLSSEKFYGNAYQMKALFAMNKETGDCRIVSIDGSVDSAKPRLGTDYIVFQKKDTRDESVKYKGQLIEYNSFDQAVMPGAEHQLLVRELEFKDPDVTMSAKKSDDHAYVFNYKSARWRLKPHADITLSNYYQVSKPTALDTKVSGSEYGLDLGYVFPSKQKFKTSIYFGAAVGTSKIDMNLSSYDYSYSTNQDVDGDQYTRHYQDVKLSQGIKNLNVIIPLYFDFDIRFHRYVSLYLQLGAKMYLNVQSKMQYANGDSYAYGMYKYGSELLRLDENFTDEKGHPYNGFGTQVYSMSDLDPQLVPGVKKFTVDAFGGIGIRGNIPYVPLTVEVGVNYQLGFMNVIEKTGNEAQFQSTNISDINRLLVWNTVSTSDLSNQNHVANMTSAFSSIKRRFLQLKIALAYKF